jgi:glycosyltransferase involved in cell wall biosynthesis
MLSVPTYVIVTPARNEAQYIELTLKSVIAQTVRPLKWVIISDGSTDGMDEIVSRYTTDHPSTPVMLESADCNTTSLSTSTLTSHLTKTTSHSCCKD